ncbi:hypothetical protein HON52_00570 [Candidatus Uhrbacteria bacterium]|jgi:hypothetical protein|nr:hypothetical protein [Candidatus Uhrbacteria bacterium]
MAHVKNPNAKWYIELSNRFSTLMSNLGLADETSSQVKNLLVEIAQEQYMAGNRSGIRWAREQAAPAR